MRRRLASARSWAASPPFSTAWTRPNTSRSGHPSSPPRTTTSAAVSLRASFALKPRAGCCNSTARRRWPHAKCRCARTASRCSCSFRPPTRSLRCSAAATPPAISTTTCLPCAWCCCTFTSRPRGACGAPGLSASSDRSRPHLLLRPPGLRGGRQAPPFSIPHGSPTLHAVGTRRAAGTAWRRRRRTSSRRCSADC